MADRPTPHSTAVCLLIALHSDPLSIIHKSANTSKTENNSNQDIQDHLSKVIRHIVLQTPNDDIINENSQYNITTIEETNLTQLLKSVAGTHFQYRDAAKFLFDDLKRATNSIDSLVDLFAAFRWTVAQGVIDGDSSHGIYVRKRCLGFDELGFDAVGRFWESVCDYVDEVDWNQFETGWGFNGHDKFDINVDVGHASSNNARGDFEKLTPDINVHSKWPPAPKQILRTLRLKCSTLDNQTDTTSFDEMEHSIQELLSENPELTLAHFLRFLNFTNNSERVGAIECLHRYFDYAMIHQRKDRLVATRRGVVDDSNTANGQQQQQGSNAMQHMNQAQSLSDILNQAAKKSNVVHYVAVVLSALFHRFGNDDMALLSAEESIRVAQQNGDKACFAYALGWLNTLSNDDSRSNESQNQINNGGILFNRRKNKVGNPHDAWENAAPYGSKSTTNMIEGVVNSSDAATNLQNPIMNNSEPTMQHHIYHLNGADIWDTYCRTNLASATNELLLRCYDHYLSNNDIAAAAHDLASSLLYGAHDTSNSQSFDSESLIEKLEKIKSTEKSEPSGRDKVPVNIYTNVIAQLQDIQKQNPRVVSYSWYHGILKLAHESASRSYDTSNSKVLETILYSFTPSVAQDSIQSIVETWAQSCIALCQARKWDAAISLIAKKAIPFCKKHDLQSQECAFLLELVRIKLDLCDDDPVVILPGLLDCLALSEKRSIDSIHAAALTLLSRFYLEVDDITQSQALLQAALPSVLEHCHIFYQGEAWLVASKCSLREYALTKENDDKDIDADVIIHRALSELGYSIDLFEKIDDVQKLRELYYLQAQLHNVTGSIVERDASSKKFLEMNSRITSSILPTWNSYNLLKNL